MTNGVFIYRSDSPYDDSPSSSYQFPKKYLSRARECIGDWIIYLEPTKVRATKGYFGCAKVQSIVADGDDGNLFRAIIEAGSYLDFPHLVEFNGEHGLVEQGLLNDEGKVSGRAQAAIRPVSLKDFNRIIDLGVGFDNEFLPRTDIENGNSIGEAVTPFDYDFERNRVATFGSRAIRDRFFRRRIVEAYEARCAVTGLRLINGGGRAEVEAAHIRPVEHGGPDIVTNGIALSGTVHWMFDRGLISLSDELEILVSRHVNDPSEIHNMINRNGFANKPVRNTDRPHPAFLAWHRENCFKS
jgi:putative restriction endonuclease